jgi:hypothetical protein
MELCPAGYCAAFFRAGTIGGVGGRHKYNPSFWNVHIGDFWEVPTMYSPTYFKQGTFFAIELLPTILFTIFS